MKPKRFELILWLMCLAGLVTVNNALAGLVTVYGTSGTLIGTYTSIQAGVDACPEGGTVSVSAGTYEERVNISKAIALIGNGIPTITSYTAGTTNAVSFFGTPTDKAIISGFIITGAVGDWFHGNGIYCENGNPTITNNSIIGNSYSGIYCNVSSPVIINNSITGNGQYGIYAYKLSPAISNNTISGNGMVGIHCYSSSPIISGNTINGNVLSGISCDDNASSTITNNTIIGNYQHGIYCEDSSPAISQNTITTNNEDGISLYKSSPTIINNTIIKNYQYGLFCDEYSSPTIVNNTIIGNNTDGIYCEDYSSPVITNNTINGNKENGITCYNSSSPSITNNIITRNGTQSTLYGIFNSLSNPVINSNCVWGNGDSYRKCSGPGDIHVDPQFIGSDNYRLRATSACINAGDNNATEIPATDQDGNPRIVTRVDLGAYEYQIISFTHNVTRVLGSGEIITVTMQGQKGGAATCTINGIAISLTNPPFVSGTYTGSYTVKPGDNITNATVTVYLTTGGIQYIKEAATPITLDTTPPAIAAITAPGYAAGTVAITLNIQDDESGVDRAGLWVDNIERYATQTNVSPGVSGTVTWELNTTDYQDGTHSLFGVAMDYVPNQATSTTHQIIIDNTLPGTPTLVSVTNPEANGRLDIAWTGIVDTNLAGYRFYYGTGSGEYPWTADSGTIATACQLGSLTNGLPYYLAVSAYDRAGNESGRSNEMSCTPTGQLTKIRIVDAGGNEVGTCSIIPEGSLTLYCRGYDAGDNFVRDVSGTWAVTGGIGQVAPVVGTCTTLEANSVGSGTIRVEGGGYADETGVITVNREAIMRIRIEDEAGQETGSRSITTDGALTLYCRGYDADGILRGEVNVTWTLIGDIGQISPAVGTSTAFEANRIGSVTIRVVDADRHMDETGVITVNVGALHYLRIEDGSGQEMGSYSMTTDEALILCCRGYDADNNLRGDVSGSWTVMGDIGRVSIAAGTATTLEANKLGSGWIRVEAGGLADETDAITVDVGAFHHLRIEDGSGQEMGSHSITTDETLTLYCRGYDADHNLRGCVSGSWTVTGNIGLILPAVGSSTTLEANRLGSGTIRVEAAGQTDETGVITVRPGAISRLVFVSPSVRELFVSMPGTITVQTQDDDGNVSPAVTATGIILKGDSKSRFASLPAGVMWTETGTYTIGKDANSTAIFFKQNGTSSPIIITAAIPGTNISATHSINIQPPGSSSGTIIGDDGKTRAIIAANSLSEDGAIIIDTSDVSSGINAANQRDDAESGINRLEGTLRGFELLGGSINTPVRICIPYDDPIDDEYVDGTGIQEKTLLIYRLVGTGTEASWQPILNSQVDAQANIVYADVSSLSFFIIRGRVYDTDIDAAFVYPNPYYGHRHNCIYFERLTKGSVIRIFTLTGELVREIRVNSPVEKWDVRNEYGEEVVSDMYLYLIVDPAGYRRVGKLGIIR